VNASKRYKSCTHSTYNVFIPLLWQLHFQILAFQSRLISSTVNFQWEEGVGKQGKATQRNATGTFNRELTASQIYSVLPIIQFQYRNSHSTGTTRAFRQKPTLQYKMRVYTHTHTHTHTRTYLHLLNVKSVTTKSFHTQTPTYLRSPL
jgi:hypothetical protein